MCGIVGYIGDKEVIPILVQGLKSLEYRGYDSTGIALQQNNTLNVIKSVGKLSKLEEIIKNSNGQFNKKNGDLNCGIGHTRWATHGEPSDRNAHPHFDSSESIAIVHNGIIKNYQEIKEQLVKSGKKFQTDTDTEIIAQLIASHMEKSKSPIQAVSGAISEMDGSYAISVLFKNEADKIYAVRKEAPLVIGVGKHENFLASDAMTVSQFVDKVIRLQDNEIAEITKEQVDVYNLSGKKVNKTTEVVKRTQDLMDKKGFKHFLEKEINEQASIVSNLLEKHLLYTKSSGTKKSTRFESLSLDAKFLSNIDRILILACGTAYHAGLVGKNVLEEITSVPTEVQFSSEYLNSKVLLTDKSLVIAISQSGETADTLAALKKITQSKAKIIGITNREDSALADLTRDNLLISNAGLEVSVAATKTFIAQMTMLYLLAIHISECRATSDEPRATKLKQELRMLPQLIDQVLMRVETYKASVLKYASKPDFVFIGRGINYPIALEAALKLKELSYIHASGYASGEMKHGPIAVLEPEVPVVSIVVPGETHDKVIQNSIEAKSRQAPMIAVAVDGDKKVDSIFDTVLHIPPIDEILSPFLTVIPLQFLAYYIAEALGRDVDQPRNLAKSVTVE